MECLLPALVCIPLVTSSADLFSPANTYIQSVHTRVVILWLSFPIVLISLMKRSPFVLQIVEVLEEQRLHIKEHCEDIFYCSAVNFKSPLKI